MSNQPVNVLVLIEALPAHLDEIRFGLRRLAEASRQEPGCLAYDVLTDNADPTQLTITEAWRNAAALAAHRASAHVAAALGAVQGKLKAPPQIRELTPLA